MDAMDFETLVRNEEGPLMARLTTVLGGDRATAEDVRQEAFARAWRSLPRELDPDRQRAWLHRTAANLAIDELRRRKRRPAISLDAAGDAIGASAAAEPDAAHEALAELTAAERFLLLLRLEGGFSHIEVARLLDISEDAARKRTARARASFLRAYRAARVERTPLVVLLARDEPAEPYLRWLADAGARVRPLARQPTERELALADALVLTGAVRDLHSELYGEAPRSLRGEPNLEADRADLAAVRTALALGIAFAGICRGHQLLNVATGGTLYQDVVLDGLTESNHEDAEHRVETHAGGATRSLLGRSAQVMSSHHQAVRRLGGRLRPTASSPDGVIEMIERTDRRFAIGMQWHPGDQPAQRRPRRPGTPRRGSAGSGMSTTSSPITLRCADARDRPALARLAALDSASPPAPPVLVADLEGQLLAAISLADGAVLANPFRPTAALVELLQARERQLRTGSFSGRVRPRVRRLDPPPRGGSADRRVGDSARQRRSHGRRPASAAWLPPITAPTRRMLASCRFPSRMSARTPGRRGPSSGATSKPSPASLPHAGIAC